MSISRWSGARGLKENLWKLYIIIFRRWESFEQLFFEGGNHSSPLAPLGVGEIDICARGLFGTKFNFKQLLFKAFFEVMHIFGGIEPQTEYTFSFLYIIIFQRWGDLSSPNQLLQNWYVVVGIDRLALWNRMDVNHTSIIKKSNDHSFGRQFCCMWLFRRWSTFFNPFRTLLLHCRVVTMNPAFIGHNNVFPPHIALFLRRATVCKLRCGYFSGLKSTSVETSAHTCETCADDPLVGYVCFLWICLTLWRVLGQLGEGQCVS